MNYKDNENFSNEFKTFLSFIENTLSKELPTPVISMEYFVLGFLEKQDSFAYKVLNTYLTTHKINTIHESYFEVLNKKAIAIVKPNREIKFDEFDDSNNALEIAYIQSGKTFSHFVASSSFAAMLQTDNAITVNLLREEDDTRYNVGVYPMHALSKEKLHEFFTLPYSNEDTTTSMVELAENIYNQKKEASKQYQKEKVQE